MNPTLLLTLGVVYAGVFWLGCIYRPRLALALIFACAPFPNNLGGDRLEFSLAEVNLLLSVPVFLLSGKRPLGGAILAASAFYIAVNLACSLAHWRPTTLTAMVQVVIYLFYAVTLFATLARSEEDYRWCFYGFLAAALVLAVAVTFRGTGYVLGINKNNCGSAISAGFLIALELGFQAKGWRRKAVFQSMCLVLGVGLLVTVSRGSWLCAIVGTLVIFTLRRQFLLMLRCTVVLAVVVAVCWTLMPQAKKDYVLGLSKDDWNIKMRYQSRDYALGQFYGSPVIGVGVGLRKEFDATNVVFTTLAETGVVGLASFVFLLAVVVWNLWRTHARVGRGSFSASVVAIAGALLLGKLAHGMVDHYWVRGTLMATWAAAGMSMRVKHDLLAARRRLVRQRRAERERALLEEFTPAFGTVPLLENGATPALEGNAS